MTDSIQLPTLPRGKFPRIHNAEWQVVNRPFSPEEIKQVLFDMAPSKAPGPDDFNVGFYQQTWQIVGDSVTAFAKDFFENGILPAGSNDTVITLIPKVPNPETVKKLPTIDLCNVSYKVLTKAMAFRLKEISQKLVGPFQASFVPGRQISDNILVYQEVLNSIRMRKGSSGWMVWKIGFEKAYDRLSWDFIRDTLEDIGFNHIWIRNILNYISSPRFSVAWNVEHSNWFTPGRGIRQGDPISPLLFVLYDVVLSGEASELQAETMLRCLDAFCDSSGDPLKSSMFFSSMLEKVRNRLSGWRSKSLSLAGRHVLAQSVISTIPFYTMQTTLVPRGVIQSIERLIRSFLWGANEGERRCNLVNWNTVTRCKSNGGLGIQKLEEMNTAFLAKLGWRLIIEEDSLWAKVFRSKYSISSAPLHCHGGPRGICPMLGKEFSRVFPFFKQWEAFHNLLPEGILDMLATTFIVTENNLPDQLVWKNETSGHFTATSAYGLAPNDPDAADKAAWENIWKLRVPNRIRTFLWLMKHDRAMTNANRAKRGFTLNDNCWVCPTVVEDIEHVLRRCPKAEASLVTSSPRVHI
ncbi:PREDICTED: uncharacterized protein LOC109167899 [Ipomoea nil]|uniref:uncharacterized protein LOC109167899 n=1 Tax=Ipomoea nil TaxID=35883 RepID=UPI0009017385|nr:PREDICTED: uncharacterized protein LOC109167899 [Ipomoea nil]